MMIYRQTLKAMIRSLILSMASALMKKSVMILMVLVTVCGILPYVMQYRSIVRKVDLGTTMNYLTDQVYINDADMSYFQVDKDNLNTDELELERHINGNDESKSSHHSLHIEGLSHFINPAQPYIRSDSKLENDVLAKEHFFKIDRTVKEVNCRSLIRGNFAEMERAHNLSMNGTHQTIIEAEQFIDMTDNCSDFITERGYVTDYLTEEEKEFPIAFSLLMFRDVEHSERLLRAIYRPQHIYCIHVDSKCGTAIYQAMLKISNCFENVFIASKRFNVEWGTMTVLEPELLCMEELWSKSKTWKYFINLTGQEFPLRTNHELVQILKSYNGANDVEVGRPYIERWKDAGIPPHGIIPTKGSLHIVASRGYVDFVLHDQIAHDFLSWTRKTTVPDETFFATLNHNPMLGVPGSYKGSSKTDLIAKPSVGRFKNWGNGTDTPCKGQRVRNICVFGTGDLPLLSSRPELFANKFYLHYQHFALDCMEELHFNNSRDEYLGKLAFDARWYSKLGFVLNKVE